MITAEQLKEMLTPEKIVFLMKSLGAEDYKEDRMGNLIFPTICHGGESYKLYYYIESGMFRCYTECGCSYDIFALIQKIVHCDFKESLRFVAQYLGVDFYRKDGFTSTVKPLTDDWSIIEKYNQPYTNKEPTINVYNESLLDYFTDLPHINWLNDGISLESIKKYNIKFDVAKNKIIIPHYDINGKLIGIRGRALNEWEIAEGKKYMPLFMEGELYNHPLGYNLYGIHIAKEAIKRIGKAMLVEGEKSVLLSDTYYGDNNFCVATCGSSISNFQRDMILSLGVKEVFIAYDKEFEKAFTEESDEYSKKILNLAKKFSPFVTTYVLWDSWDVLNKKDSPMDKGKDVLQYLMANKYEVHTDEGV